MKIDAKAISEKYYEKAKELLNVSGLPKTLAIVTVGNDESSKVYVERKKVKCEECGALYRHIQLSEKIDLNTLKRVIRDLNDDANVDGIIIQKPLPKHLLAYDTEINNLVDPDKDVDGLNPSSIFVPCTPYGVLKLLTETKINLEGKFVVIAGRSDLVAKPLANLLMKFGCTVVMIHTKTPKDLVKQLINNCDIFISSIGKPHYWTSEYLNLTPINIAHKTFITPKKKIALIDVGITRTEEGLKGDISPECYGVADWYTTVPGGVGLTTVAMLMYNLSLT